MSDLNLSGIITRTCVDLQSKFSGIDHDHDNDYVSKEDYRGKQTWGNLKGNSTWGELIGNPIVNSPTTTTNLQLIKPSYDDTVDVDTFNDNMDIIDSWIGDYRSALTWGEVGDKYAWGLLGTTSQTTGQTSTTNLALAKPGNNSTVDIATLNSNSDKIDAAIGALQDSVSIGKGTFNTEILFVCGHVSGSGNYAELFFPYRLASGITSASLSYTDNAQVMIFLVDKYVNMSGIDASYCVIAGTNEKGFLLELKFLTTQQSNRPCVCRFSGSSITFE